LQPFKIIWGGSEYMSISIKRINDGKPIIEATNSWEKYCTANSGAIFLERNPENDGIIENIIGKELMKKRSIKNGFVVSLYTGVGKYKDDVNPRQYRGLAIFTPDMELIKKLDYPVIRPSDNTEDIDSAGIEDARLTKVGKIFYAWYCGFNGKDGAACAAYSEDLIHWIKVAPLKGNINDTYNKDHVIFQEPIMERWWMLHRPWGPKVPVSDMVIRLAVSDNLLGPWEDAGAIIRAYDNPKMESVWDGAGPAPISLGNNRFLLLYHTGSYFKDKYRQYDACVALLDFNLYSEDKPENIVIKRIEPLMVPETEWEINKDLRIDIVFPMGAFIYKEDIIFTYGAGDRYTCAAKIPLNEILQTLQE